MAIDSDVDRFFQSRPAGIRSLDVTQTVANPGAAPGQERKRLFSDADSARRLRELGLSDVRIDVEGNVIGLRPGSGDAPRVALAAHLDTVFAAGTDVKVRR